VIPGACEGLKLGNVWRLRWDRCLSQGWHFQESRRKSPHALCSRLHVQVQVLDGLQVLRNSCLCQCPLLLLLQPPTQPTTSIFLADGSPLLQPVCNSSACFIHLVCSLYQLLLFPYFRSFIPTVACGEAETNNTPAKSFVCSPCPYQQV